MLKLFKFLSNVCLNADTSNSQRASKNLPRVHQYSSKLYCAWETRLRKERGSRRILLSRLHLLTTSKSIFTMYVWHDAFGLLLGFETGVSAAGAARWAPFQWPSFASRIVLLCAPLAKSSALQVNAERLLCTMYITVAPRRRLAFRSMYSTTTMDPGLPGLKWLRNEISSRVGWNWLVLHTEQKISLT